MNSKTILKYIFFSIIPMVMAKGAIFIANIVTANQMTVEHFSQLSEIYLCAAIMATPVIASLNQYVSIVNEKAKNLIILALILSVFTSLLSTLYYVFFFNDFNILINIVMVFFFTLVIILSGSVSAVFIGSGIANKLNVSALIGGILFTILIFIFIRFNVTWYFYFFLYLTIPITNLIISPFLLKTSVELVNKESNQLNQRRTIIKLLLIAVMGAPVQLILVATLRALDLSGFELARLNIAYQWHMLVILLPTMISAVLLKFLAERKAVVQSIYRYLSYAIACALALLIIAISGFAEALYSYNGKGLAAAIAGYAIAGVLSVFYHVELNTFLSEFTFDKALRMVGINALIYLLVGWVGLQYYPVTLTLAIAMSVSYGITIVFIKLRFRQKA